VDPIDDHERNPISAFAQSSTGFTCYTGFKVNSGEYKVMGLAPYGEPKYASLIFEHLMTRSRTAHSA
jgi:predicted NodU family carbamoyl transferase